MRRRRYFGSLIFIFSIAAFLFPVTALSKSIESEVGETVIDGSTAPYNTISGGDTIWLMPGKRNFLLIRNLRGTPDRPVLLINKDGFVSIDTDHHYGISVQNCRFFRLSGSGYEGGFYGIRIDRVARGSGLGVGGMSSDFEIDHIRIRNVPIAGIYAKSDPDCSLETVRGSFMQFNTHIHNVLIENAGNEGMYIGSSNYSGQTVNCFGKDTLLLPSLLYGVKIHDNIIRNSGWDGIQVSSAIRNCQVYNNLVEYDSQAEVQNQMSGILLGGGSKCDCYNNYITDGSGIGIEFHGLGGSRIFNNVIVNAGRSYLPGNQDPMYIKHGIFISDVSLDTDSSVYIQHNTIIRPKTEGIRFASIKSRNSVIASNAIVEPGSKTMGMYGYQDNKPGHPFVSLADGSREVVVTHNYFGTDLSKAGLAEDFSPLDNSPLIDAGYDKFPFIPYDIVGFPRSRGGVPDIGAYEFDHQTADSILRKSGAWLSLFPNPAGESVTLKFNTNPGNEAEIEIFDVSGKRIDSISLKKIAPGTHFLRINIAGLNPGFYLLKITIPGKTETLRLIKRRL